MTVVDTETDESANTINYEIHPVAALFPFIEGEAFREFVEDIRINGQREPVVLDVDGRLLDGRNRARACQALGVDVKETRYSGDDAEAWIISHNVHRRHLTESQRAMVAAKLSNLRAGGTGGRVTSSIEDVALDRRVSLADAAKALNVSKTSVERARLVRDHATPDVQQAVERGEMTVGKAAAAIRETRVAPTTTPRPVGGAPFNRQQRADLITELAAQGYSSRQMPAQVGVSEETVRQIARDFDIEIPADRSVGKSRRINSTQVVENTATALEGLVMGVELIDYTAVDIAVASQWADSLTESLKVLNGFARQIRKAAQ